MNYGPVFLPSFAAKRRRGWGRPGRFLRPHMIAHTSGRAIPYLQPTSREPMRPQGASAQGEPSCSL